MTDQTSATAPRILGKSRIEVSPMGLGGWAIGGPWTFLGAPGGWSAVDDDESTAAIRRAVELGVTFFDTAANYGAGHSERVLGAALSSVRDDVVIATKFGYRVDESAREVTPYPDGDVAEHLREDLHASLRRLGTDHLDVYQLHVGDLSIERALEAREVLEELVREGTIRTYGWSTDDVERARAFSDGPSCGLVQHGLSLLGYEDPAMLALCDELDLASVNRSPLGMGLLTGKFDANSTFAEDDQRRQASWHPGFVDGRPTEAWLGMLDAIRQVLTSNGRSLAQGALAWIWARSPRTIPIPGFRNVAQVEDDAGAIAAGPLTSDQMADIDHLIAKSAAASAG